MAITIVGYSAVLLLSVNVVASVSLLQDGPPVTLQGRVIFTPSSADIAVPDYSHMLVFAWKASDDRLREQADAGLVHDTLPPPVSPRPDGTFQIPGLTPGVYRMRVLRVPRGWFAASGRFGNTDPLDVPIEITSSTASAQSVTLQFTDRPTVLAGKLVSSGGLLPSGQTVVVFPRDRQLWSGRTRRTAIARVGADGSFEIKSLPAGEYFVVATDAFRNADWMNRDRLESLAASALSVTLAPGERTVLELKTR